MPGRSRAVGISQLADPRCLTSSKGPSQVTSCDSVGPSAATGLACDSAGLPPPSPGGTGPAVHSAHRLASWTYFRPVSLPPGHPSWPKSPPQAQTMPARMEEGPTQAPSRPAEAPCIAALSCSLRSGEWVCCLCPPGGANTETPPGNAPHRGWTLLAIHWAWPGAGCREHRLLPSLQAPHQGASMVYSEMAGKGACPGHPARGHWRAPC